MAFYNEAYDERRKVEDALMQKWHKALEVNGISNEHTARTVAILLENYMEHLHSDPKLIAEDQIQTGAFTGVNLALLGLIARVIPSIIGLELVGTQALPTPRSPIFTMQWYKSFAKGQTSTKEEMWVSPTPAKYPVGIDPYYSSQQVRAEEWTASGGDAANTLVWANVTNDKGLRPLLFNDTMFVTIYDATGAEIAVVKFTGNYNSSASSPIAGVVVSGGAFGANMAMSLLIAGGTLAKTIQCYDTNSATACNLTDLTFGGTAAAEATIDYEYQAENEGSMPEIQFEISEDYVTLIRRQLRGKYTLDAAYDLKRLHGIDLEQALLDMMKQELMAEINREIITDLRLLAGITKTLDFNLLPTAGGTQVSVNANYNDAMLAILDAVEKTCASIWNVGRRGMGNFAVGNPETLSFLDRVPGFVGSGVSYNGRDMAFAGSLGGKIKFYHDPNYPKNELLIGYKGTSAIDSGYIYAPYLPITATPTLLDPQTGNPSKLYYTRYGKTFQDRGNTDGSPKNLILMGEYQYARLIIQNLPTLFQ